MEKLTGDSVERMKDSLENSKLDEYKKKILFELFVAILNEDCKKIYTTKADNFVEYLTIKDQPEDNMEKQAFCIVKKMIDEYTGSIDNSSYAFPSYDEVIDYYKENRAVFDIAIAKGSESSNVENNIFDEFRNRINEMRGLSGSEVKRAVNVINAIEHSKRGKLFIVKNFDYEEYLTVRDNKLCLGKRMIDYNGSTINREHDTLTLADFVNYLEENKDKLGEFRERRIM